MNLLKVGWIVASLTLLRILEYLKKNKLASISQRITNAWDSLYTIYREYVDLVPITTILGLDQGCL
jgi:hypothetical protein